MKFPKQSVFIVSTLIAALFFLACSQEYKSENGGVSSSEPQSLIDILNSSEFRSLYKGLIDKGEITGEQFGSSGMVIRFVQDGKRESHPEVFSKICSPWSAYELPLFGTKELNLSNIRYKSLNQENREIVNSFVIGVATDNFYCGSVMQLSFPLEDAVDEVEDQAEKLCLSNLKTIREKPKRYQVLFHDPIKKDPSILNSDSTIKDIILLNLRSKALCDLSPNVE